MNESSALRIRELDLEKPPSAEVAACLEAWRGWCAPGCAMPVWRNVDCLHDLPRTILPWIGIVDVSDDPRDYRYAFWGSGLTRSHHIDLTGKSYRDLNSPQFAAFVGERYDDVLDRHVPILTTCEFLEDNGRKTRELTMRAPFSPDDRTIDKIIVIVWADSANDEEWFHKQWPSGQ